MEPEQSISLDERKGTGKPLVLIVDDDLNHHKLFELLSDRLGIIAHMATSCAMAIEALKTFSFDVILMDYRMPEVDGCACTRHIREMKELTNKIPIIAVTAHVMAGSREKCLEAGMDDFLGKPFTLDELHEKLCFWLQKKME